MNDHSKKIISCVIFGLAVAMIAYGVMSGGLRDVWARASMVCLECIGIG